MRKKNSLKKMAAIAMAAVMAGSTNMGGWQSYANVYASDKGGVSGIYTVDGIQWNVCENKTTGKVELQLSSPLTVEGRDIVVPTVVEGTKIDVLADGSGFKAKSVTIPDGIEVGVGALDGCSVDTLYYKGASCYGDCVPENCKNIVFDGTENISLGAKAASVESITCKNAPGVCFGYKAIANAKHLKCLVIEDSINRVTFDSNALASCVSLEQCEIHSESAVMYQAAFANCMKLRDVTFDGYAIFHTSQYYCGEEGEVAINQGGAFYNCFQKEYDSDGDLIKKTLTFRDGIGAESNDDAPDCRTRVVENCSGLTDVVIDNGAELYSGEFFYDCENLSNITFYGQTVLSSSLFQKLPSLKKLEFHGEVEGVSNVSTPFDGCTADMLVFWDSVRQMTISGMKNLTTIYFGGKHVGLYELNSGTWQRNVTLENCDNLESIIFDLDPEALSNWDENGELNRVINLEDNLTRPHNIYGYNYNKCKQNFIEYWVKNHSKGTFVNMIERVETYFDGQMLGENLTAKDIDRSKIIVKATFAHKVAQCLKQIGYTKYDFDFSLEEITVPLSTGYENTGYEIEMLPDTIVEGKNMYKVMYSGIVASGIIESENKAAIGLTVNWNESAIEELVANQPITAEDVAMGGIITYNNGTKREVDVSELVLSTNSCFAGENVIIVSLKDNPQVSEQKTISVCENYIVSISATYEGDNTLYVGDKIDVNKIKLTPTYKFEEDTTVSQQIDFTKVSSLVLANAGENVLQVYYNDLVADLTISALDVVPVKVYAFFDSTKYSYKDGQEIDPKSVAVTVEYNNGSRKSGEEISYAYTINEKVRTKDCMTATVTYEGVESESFLISVIPKEVSHIKVTSSVLSAIEGTRIVPTAITGIEVFYNNGKSDVLDALTIDYEEVVFSNYEIVANAANTITVTYLGKSDTITIYGIPNTIASIYAEYKGSGAVVGSTLTPEDVAVYALNGNGAVTNITQGILLENATIYTVGENRVTIHYGSHSCTITVTGLPTGTANAPTDTELENLQPTGILLPDAAASEGHKTDTDGGEKKEVGTPSLENKDSVVSASDMAGSAVPASASALQVQANVKNIQLAVKVDYKVYTNKTIKLTVVPENAKNVSYQLVKKKGKVQDDKWLAVTNRAIIIKKTARPVVIYFTYTDATGSVQMVHTNGFYVDKKKATVNVKAGGTYKKGYKLTFKDAGGIKSAILDGKKVKSGVKVKKRGSHTILVTDKAGNKRKVVFKVK